MGTLYMYLYGFPTGREARKRRNVGRTKERESEKDRVREGNRRLEVGRTRCEELCNVVIIQV